MISITINNGIKEHTHGCQNCDTNQLLIFCGYVKVRESLCTRISFWDSTISDHIDTRMILPRYKVLSWSMDPNGIENKNIVRYIYIHTHTPYRY